MRTWLTIAILLSISLAGCSESPTESEPVDDHVEHGDDHNVTDLPAVPTAALNLDLVNGTAPLLVNFTIEATNATAWSLDFGEGNATNGTDFPAAVNHTFGAGLFNITLTVMGEGGNATQNATLNVTAVPEEIEVVLEPFSATVTMDLPCPGCGDGGTSTCTWRVHGDGAAQDCAWIDFPDELVGQPFTLTGQGLDADLLFWDSCNSGVNDKFHGSGDESGVIPAGAGCVLVWEQLDPMVDLVFTITPV